MPSRNHITLYNYKSSFSLYSWMYKFASSLVNKSEKHNHLIGGINYIIAPSSPPPMSMTVGPVAMCH